MTTATATRTETDIAAQVEAAFNELECCSTITAISHGGDKAAYCIRHESCSAKPGWLCKNHYDNYVAVVYPENMRVLRYHGVVRCPSCKRKFPNLDAFDTVIPI